MNSLNKFLLLIPEVNQVYWMIVRGVENSAIMLGELELPPSARLKVSRVNASLHNGQLVTLASAPAGTDGAGGPQVRRGRLVGRVFGGLHARTSCSCCPCRPCFPC